MHIGVREVVEGNTHGPKPDVTVTVQEKDLKEIINGKLSLKSAYKSGAFKVS